MVVFNRSRTVWQDGDGMKGVVRAGMLVVGVWNPLKVEEMFSDIVEKRMWLAN